MKQSIYNDELQPQCAYCAFGKPAATGTEILCFKKGVVEPGFACRKFEYDPLKRDPKQLKPLEAFSAEDFAL